MLGRLLEPAESRGGFQHLWGSGALFARQTASGTSVTQDSSLQAVCRVRGCTSHLGHGVDAAGGPVHPA